MSTKVTHRERYGKTTDWRGTAVYVAREAWLPADLSRVVDTVVTGIVLRRGDGYNDADEWTFERRHAEQLYEALGAALMATAGKPVPLAEWERELLSGESATDE